MCSGRTAPISFAVAAQIMRRIMIDHARQRHALKRGGGAIKVTLDECAAVTQTRAAELLALDEALEKLAAFDPRKSKVVEMRYFGGLTMEEIADVLKIHVNTVTRDCAEHPIPPDISGKVIEVIACRSQSVRK